MEMRKVYFYNMYVPIRIKETSEYSIENDWGWKATSVVQSAYYDSLEEALDYRSSSMISVECSPIMEGWVEN